jgi:hypothetical protein
MTTGHDHHDPLDDEKLSDEERDLAARLGRIGPFDGPSPALDAKILAAAHAAVATTRTPGRRRLAWLGVPPALVTGAGVAAAAVLALGLVWQLRPQPGMVAAQSEADSGEEVILMAEPAGVPAAPRANPPPYEEDSAAAPAGRAQRAMAAKSVPSSRDSAKAVAAMADEAAAQQASAQAAQAKKAASAEEKREAEVVARDAAAESGFAAEPPATSAPERRNHATYTTAARARAEQRERAAGNAAPPAPAPASAPPTAEAAPETASAAASADASTLDRIEVTGSRVRQDAYVDWSQVPVGEDSRLAAADWLERIRARRDDEDTENARASLRLFQREHPRVRLPDDLRELLADSKR